VEAGQLRGLTSFAAAVVKMFLLDVYDDAELERKKQAARFATFIKRDIPDFAGDTQWAQDYYAAVAAARDDDSPLIGHYGPGSTVELSEGDDVSFSEPADVGPNYEPFQFRTLLQVCSALGIPYAEFSGDLSRTSYASSRAGLIAFRGEVEAFQHAVLVFQFLRPVWRRFWQAGVLSGALPVTAARYNRERRELVRYKAIVPRAPWVDPLKDRQAEKLAVDAGFKARSDVIEAEGYDPEEVDQRIAEDKAREERLGISFAATFGRSPSQRTVVEADQPPQPESQAA
ncbi:MAG: phage portal protein, partial [Alphaproteobacteria bacterium]|nr:phage portal protein [Alphaproteobacteria bacterium]